MYSPFKNTNPTYEEYLDAVREDGMLISRVPREKLTEEICIIAFSQNLNNFTDFELLPIEHKTPKVNLTAVTSDPGCLCYVPEEMETEELCFLAVKGDPWTIRYVPETVLTEEMCLLAVKEDGETLQVIPEKFRTYSVCKEAIQTYGNSILYVPKEILTEELCISAMSNWVETRHHVYDEISERNFYYDILGNIPKEFLTKDVCLTAIQKNKDNLYFVPQHLLEEIENIV